jgi:murein DD-endopeptidase MepM/ murein hydrolase activator NlpD
MGNTQSNDLSGLGQRLSQFITPPDPQPDPDAIQRALQQTQQSQQQNTILPNPVPVTQQFGNYNPNLEVFSGGYAMDTNFGAKEGDPVALPPGRWQIVNQNDSAGLDGQPGNGENAGYGRAILAQNLDTGDRLHFIHLHDVNTQLGDIVQGGQPIATVGHSGNATAENLGLEYYDPSGKIGDFMQSPYAQFIPVK